MSENHQIEKLKKGLDAALRLAVDEQTERYARDERIAELEEALRWSLNVLDAVGAQDIANRAREALQEKKNG